MRHRARGTDVAHGRHRVEAAQSSHLEPETIADAHRNDAQQVIQALGALVNNNRMGNLPTDCGDFIDRVAGLFEAERDIPAGQAEAHRLARGHAPIGVHNQLCPGADAFPHLVHDGDIDGDIPSPGLDLNPAVTFVNLVHRQPGDFIGFADAGGVVGRQPFGFGTAKQVTDPQAMVLAHHVHQRDIDGRLGIVVPHQQTVHLAAQQQGRQRGLANQGRRHLAYRGPRPECVLRLVNGSYRRHFSPADESRIRYHFDYRGIDRVQRDSRHGVGSIDNREVFLVDMDFTDTHIEGSL